MRLLSFLILVVFLAGCSSGEHVVDVSGKVLLDGHPLPMGTVTFAPDKEKGNTAPANGFSPIKEDGSYSLIYKGKNGVPPGWYKVGVSSFGMPSTMPEMGKAMPATPKINPKLINPETSGIRIEVVPAPDSDAYTIKVTK
jgi:hypothetical protein